MQKEYLLALLVLLGHKRNDIQAFIETAALAIVKPKHGDFITNTSSING